MLKFDEMVTQLPYAFLTDRAKIREHYKIYDAWLARQWDPLESTCRHASLSIL